jgi:serine protease Do
MNDWMLATLLSLCWVGDVTAQIPDRQAPDPSTESNERVLTAAELVDLVRPSLATIRVEDRAGNERGMGTGFVVSSDGLLATNLHVIGEGRSFVVQMADGTNPKVLAVEASDHKLDLALIRIAVDPDNPLRPLALSDQEVRQGTPVIAMGNPWGLEKSVVSGVTSAIRRIGGRNLIQMAMPIEFGNSGSPVVDHHGKVVGIVNMKSATEQNIGFAIQSESLQLLIDKPNPVPIDGWSTIGAMNPERWTPLFGGRWREHGGRISVSGIGSGFGGRSICLAVRDVPAPTFEIAVTVKLDDEAGAAGLVFHSDGNQRHYAFYPTNGKLRLTSFEGPTVFSWRILADKPSQHYRPGDWNELRVRVEKNKLLCFVNGQLEIESSDTTFTKGQVGLAKFRQTEAEFRRFRVGEQLSKQLSADAFQQAAKAIDELPPFEELVDEQLKRLSNSAEANIAFLALRARQRKDQAESLKNEVQQLEKLLRDIDLQVVAKEFGEAVAAEEVDLLDGALLIARFAEPDLESQIYVSKVAQMAERIRDSLPADATEADRFAALNTFLFSTWGYHGSRFEYYDRANSFINRVIDDREGLPITLSVLYIEVGRRLGLKIEGVGLPGHFVVRYVPTEGEPQLVDVFDGGTLLTQEEAEMLILARGGPPLTREHMLAADGKEILARMLRNAYAIAHSEEDKEAQLKFLEGLLVLDPDSIQFRGLRAVVRRETGRRAAAIADLDRILESDVPQETLDEIRRIREFFQRR